MRNGNFQHHPAKVGPSHVPPFIFRLVKSHSMPHLMSPRISNGAMVSDRIRLQSKVADCHSPIGSLAIHFLSAPRRIGNDTFHDKGASLEQREPRNNKGKSGRSPIGSLSDLALGDTQTSGVTPNSNGTNKCPKGRSPIGSLAVRALGDTQTGGITSNNNNRTKTMRETIVRIIQKGRKQARNAPRITRRKMHGSTATTNDTNRERQGKASIVHI